MPNSVTYTFKLVDRFSAGGRQIAKTTAGIQRQMVKLGGTATAAGAKMTAAGKKMQTTSLVAAGAVVSSLKAFGDLEKGVTNVLTLLDTPQEVERFRGEFNRLAQDAVRMGFSIDDTTKSLFDTVSALGAGSETAATFAAAQRLAIGGVTDLSVAVDGITSITNAYSEENLKATDIATAFFSAQKKGKTTVALLASNVGKVAPIAKAAGIGMKELLATTAQLTLGGLSTEEATTALRAAISSLIKPGKEAEKILSALGIPFGATQLKANGLGETLRRLTIANEKYPDALAKAIPNVRAFTAVASLQEEQLKNVDSIINLINSDIANNTGLTEAAAAQMQTFNFEASQTFGSLKILAAQIGEALAPAVRLLGKLFRGLSSVFEAMGPMTKKIVAGFLAVAAIAAPLLLFMGKLGAVVGFIAAAIGGSFAAVGAAVVVSIAAIVGAIGLLIFKFDLVKEKFSSGIGAAKKFFGFGGGDLDVTGSGLVEQSSKLQADVNIRAPKGVVESVQSKTTGRISGLNLGVALEESL